MKEGFEKIVENILTHEQYKFPVNRNYHAFTLSTIDKIKQLKNVKQKIVDDMKIVAHVLPFKVNNYVLNYLINWQNVPNDPIFRLVFPQRGMLSNEHFRKMKKAVGTGDKKFIHETAKEIRIDLNPYPAGQKDFNMPTVKGENLSGVQYKYRETALFFPKEGQTCHAYCTFCFRWSQFVSVNDDHKFSSKSIDSFIAYLQKNPEISDILLTGGDPMVMKSKNLEKYILPILDAEIPHIRTIRIGSKVLSYWPQRFIDDMDSDHVLSILSEVTARGKNLAFMAHLNHYQELQTSYLEMAVKELKKTGAKIMTQSPLINNINASSNIWAKMWKIQHDLGMVPYYMFVIRDTGAKDYFNVPLVKAWEIFKGAYNQVSGLCRTVRGPSMSCTPGKINILGPVKINGKKALALNFIQGRNPDWVNRPFFAEYDTKATWIDELKPITGEKFFFEEELKKFLKPFSEIKKKT
ncbi:MAG: 4Fe-4S cluster-binding domain-containing protein [Candidatus Heimdallarchaeota archaeon]|nr:4Fe-4S cluster-binding domain-containing protein [Candidatus Heimdallarchaeota archaeon]